MASSRKEVAQKDLRQVYHEGSQVWLPIHEVVNSLAGSNSKKNSTQWKRGRVEVRRTFFLVSYKYQRGIMPELKMQAIEGDGSDVTLSVRTEDNIVATVPAVDCCLQNERDDIVDDLVKSDFLHEPGYVCSCLIVSTETRDGDAVCTVHTTVCQHHNCHMN